MANISAYYAKLGLDWVTGAAAATQPASRLIGLSKGTPSSVSGSEVGTGSGYARQSGLFAAANSPAGSASNSASMVFGPFSSSDAIQGIHFWDTISISSGNMFWYGTLNTARTVLPGDTLVVNAGSLTLTLS